MIEHPAESIRLSKRVAALVPCSRREAEQYIEHGWVLVDGQVIEEPQFRVQQQKVELHPDATLLTLAPVSILLHKPVGYEMAPVEGRPSRLPSAPGLLSPSSQSPDDRSGIRVLKAHFTRLQPTTPLPSQASGLVVYTQDWRIARKLLDDADGNEQEVIVDVAGEVGEAVLQRLRHGLSFNGRPLPPIKVSVNSQSDTETRLRFALKGVQPGQIPSMCESVGLKLLAIKRIRIARVPMGPLAPGQWRYLAEHERF